MRNFWGAWKLVPKELKRELLDLVIDIMAFIALIIVFAKFLDMLGSYAHQVIWDLNGALLMLAMTHYFQKKNRGWPNQFDIPWEK